MNGWASDNKGSYLGKKHSVRVAASFILNAIGFSSATYVLIKKPVLSIIIGAGIAGIVTYSYIKLFCQSNGNDLADNIYHDN